MPTKPRPEDTLVELFLSAYDGHAWASSERQWLDRQRDGAVELLATRADGRTLAIEHTLIESFIGEREDFERFRRFLRVEQDLSLAVPGKIIYVNVPRGVLAKGQRWESIVDGIHDWLRRTVRSFPEGRSTLTSRVDTNGAPDSIDVSMEVIVEIDPDFKGLPPLIRRYGPVNVSETVEKALKAKLPKLVRTDADVRILLLERNQWTLDEKEIVREIDIRRPTFAELQQVEIWVVETVTASADRLRGYIAFKRYVNGTKVEGIAFNHGKLFSRSKDGMPVALPADPGAV